MEQARTLSRLIFMGILLSFGFLQSRERFVRGQSFLSQQTTDYNCAFCKLLKTLVSKQNAMDRKMEKLSQQNKNLERKIDLLLGAKANCSEGKG